MSVTHIGFLHPGAMGVSLAAAAKNTGHKSYWVPHGRSPETRLRAETHGLLEIPQIVDLCKRCAVIVSVCPPHAAFEVAEEVCSCSFKGVFVDANAISPQRTRQINQLMSASGIDFVDGGIIGPPAWQANRTWLYLSGPSAGWVSRLFSGGPLEIEIIGTEAGKASALKMCFAANTKGTTALLATIMAAADRLGVRQELETQWSRQSSDYAHSTIDRVRKATAKAWRFAGEMDEISTTFQSVGLPEGFHLAASEIYSRMASFKDAAQAPGLDEIVAALTTGGQQDPQR